MDIVEFLKQRLDEDEAVARAASPGGWQYGTVDSVAGGVLYDETRTIANLVYEQPTDHDGRIVRHLLSAEADRNGAHIARHDPARVLAEVEAKRRIVQHHPPDGDGELPLCTICTETGPDAQSWPCQTLRLLALPYAQHPDYEESWRP